MQCVFAQTWNYGRISKSLKYAICSKTNLNIWHISQKIRAGKPWWAWQTGPASPDRADAGSAGPGYAMARACQPWSEPSPGLISPAQGRLALVNALTRAGWPCVMPRHGRLALVHALARAGRPWWSLGQGWVALADAFARACQPWLMSYQGLPAMN